MPVLGGKSSAEQVTLQSSQEENNDGKKHKLLPGSATPERIGGHSWAGDGMKHFLFRRGEFQHM